MPRTGRRRSLTIAAALAAALAVPAAAQAATTYTVAPGGGACAGPADTTCGELQTAADAVVAGDTINVQPGLYGSVTFDVGGLTITGSGNVTVNGSVTFTAGTGGVSKLSKIVVGQPNGVASGVVANGAAGVELSDMVVISANDDGVKFFEGTANKIVRSVILTGGQTTSAVHVRSLDASTATKALTLESTFLIGGRAGLNVETGEAPLLGIGSNAGDVTVNLRHVTAGGSQNGLLLDSSKAYALLLGTPAGNITANVSDSIIQNGTAKLPVTTLLVTPNTITDTYTRSLVPPFDSNAVFVNPAGRNYRLRAGSPAINAGGVTPGESATDVDGQDRATAPTDQGADEFVASAPTTPPGSTPPGATNDGVAPEVVITRPTAGQRIKLVKKTTKVNKTTKKKTTTSKRTKIVVGGTSKDASGVKAVVLTIEKISTTVSKPKTSASSAAATTTATKKCKWLNATKGVVLKSCATPVLLLAKLAKDGTWTFSVKSTIHLGAGKYRATAVGLDNSGKTGNSAKRADAIRTFTLTK
jgi:hypothetical protein